MHRELGRGWDLLREGPITSSSTLPFGIQPE